MKDCNHKTTMTQEQRKELVRILTMNIGSGPYLTIEQVAVMNDRQISLSWLKMCEYIDEATYQREFAACVGEPLFPHDPT